MDTIRFDVKVRAVFMILSVFCFIVCAEISGKRIYYFDAYVWIMSACGAIMRGRNESVFKNLVIGGFLVVETIHSFSEPVALVNLFIGAVLVLAIRQYRDKDVFNKVFSCWKKQGCILAAYCVCCYFLSLCANTYPTVPREVHTEATFYMFANIFLGIFLFFYLAPEGVKWNEERLWRILKCTIIGTPIVCIVVGLHEYMIGEGIGISEYIISCILYAAIVLEFYLFAYQCSWIKKRKAGAGWKCDVHTQDYPAVYRENKWFYPIQDEVIVAVIQCQIENIEKEEKKIMQKKRIESVKERLFWLNMRKRDLFYLLQYHFGVYVDG